MGNRNLEIRLCIFFDRFSLPLRLDVFRATKEEDFFFFFMKQTRIRRVIVFIGDFNSTKTTSRNLSRDFIHVIFIDISSLKVILNNLTFLKSAQSFIFIPVRGQRG